MMMDKLNENIVFLAGTYVFPPGPPSELSGNSLMCITEKYLLQNRLSVPKINFTNNK